MSRIYDALVRAEAEHQKLYPKDKAQSEFLSLFPECGRARQNDPQTAKDAAKSVEASRLQRIFLETLRRYGPSTAEEVSERTHILLNSISPRTAPLVKKGLIRDSGERRAGRSGRKQIVWTLL